MKPLCGMCLRTALMSLNDKEQCRESVTHTAEEARDSPDSLARLCALVTTSHYLGCLTDLLALNFRYFRQLACNPAGATWISIHTSDKRLAPTRARGYEARDKPLSTPSFGSAIM